MKAELLVTSTVHDVARAALVNQDAFYLALPTLEGYHQGIIMRMLHHLKVGFRKGYYWSLALLCPMSLLPDLVDMLQVLHFLGLPPDLIFADL